SFTLFREDHWYDRQPGTATPACGAAGRPLPRPRGELAEVQSARPGTRRGPLPAAPRTGPLPVDLREQPGRVLHGPRRRPRPPDGDRARRPVRQRPPAPPNPPAHRRGRARAGAAARRLLPRRYPPPP